VKNPESLTKKFSLSEIPRSFRTKILIALVALSGATTANAEEIQFSQFWQTETGKSLTRGIDPAENFWTNSPKSNGEEKMENGKRMFRDVTRNAITLSFKKTRYFLREKSGAYRIVDNTVAAAGNPAQRSEDGEWTNFYPEKIENAVFELEASTDPLDPIDEMKFSVISQMTKNLKLEMAAQPIKKGGTIGTTLTLSF